MLGLHTNHLDFEILDTGNSKTLVFVDSSEYIEQPDRPLIEVTLPGYDKYFLVNVNANAVNTYNSNTLGLSRVMSREGLIELPDGVWKIRFKICPYEYIFKDKYFVRITKLMEKLHKLYNEIDMSECKSKDDKDLQTDLIQVHALIEGSKAIVNQSVKKSQEYYQLADRILSRQLDRFCKHCK